MPETTSQRKLTDMLAERRLSANRMASGAGALVLSLIVAVGFKANHLVEGGHVAGFMDFVQFENAWQLIWEAVKQLPTIAIAGGGGAWAAWKKG